MHRFTEALYFPHIEVNDPSWLRSAILYWGVVKTIVPTNDPEPYMDDDLKECLQARVLEPLRIRNFPNAIESASDDLLRNFDFYQRETLISAAHLKQADELESYGNIYPEKMSESLREKLLESTVEFGSRELVKGMGDRKISPILAETKIIFAYMALLARQVGRDTRSQPVTSYSSFRLPQERIRTSQIDFPDHATQFGPRHGGYFPKFGLSAAENGREHFLIELLVENTLIDPSVSITKILNFRKRNHDQLLQLTGWLEELQRGLSHNPSAADVKRFYELRIEPEIREYRRSLEKNSIPYFAAGALALPAIPDSAVAIAEMFGTSPLLALGATGALVAGGVALHNNQSTQRNAPLSYVANANRSFGFPEWRRNAEDRAKLVAQKRGERWR